MSRLTEDAVADCRRRYAAGESQRALAAEYRVSAQAMSNAITGATWRWLPGAVPIDTSRRGARGGANPRTKLSPEILGEIKRRNANGESQRALAAEYGVWQGSLWKAIHGWKPKG